MIKPIDLYFKLRWLIRANRIGQRALYVPPSLWYSTFGRLTADTVRPPALSEAKGVAMCLRFRDEARFLREWIEYHLSAGASKLFLYNNSSSDDFAGVIAPYQKDGSVECIDWPRTPASPHAEEDCIRRAVGRFEWVGFLDTDEFVVVKDLRSIGEFLSEFRSYPAVALHWHMFGSNGHLARPSEPVIAAYTRRAPHPNCHVKCFVRPECAAQCRNSHSWYFRGARCAGTETGGTVYGSLSIPPTAERAWVNHYYSKSKEDYIGRMNSPAAVDRLGMLYPSRRPDRLEESMSRWNDVIDDSALLYYQARCRMQDRPRLIFDQ